MSASNGAVYTRDSFGQRVRKDASGAATEYYYFGGTLLATRDPSSSQWTDYIYAGSRLIAQIPVTSTDTPFYRIGDHLDSLAGKTDSSGNVLGTNDVSPYGELFSSSASDPLLFTQHEQDGENGSDSALFRQYASTQGRWLSPDPYNGSYNLADPQSLNRYTYVAGRPLASVDSNGLFLNGSGDDGGDGDGGFGLATRAFWPVWGRR
jgi:RHS repeat-associated protein